MNKTFLFALAALGSALPAAHAQGTGPETGYHLDFIEYLNSDGYNDSYSNYTVMGGAYASMINSIASATSSGNRGAGGRLPPTTFTTNMQWHWAGAGAPQPFGLTYTYALSTTAQAGSGAIATGTLSVSGTDSLGDTISTTGSSPVTSHIVHGGKGINKLWQQIVSVCLHGGAEGRVGVEIGQGTARLTHMSTVLATLTPGELDVSQATFRNETINP